MDLLENLAATWFKHPEWWFHASEQHDAYIRDTYGHMLDTGFPDSQNSPLDNQQRLGRIILWDQIPYHVYRGQPAKHVICWFNQLAIRECRFVLQENALDAFTHDEWAFVLLPLRHTNVPHMCWEAAHVAWSLMMTHTQTSNNILQRFLRATYANCPTRDQSPYVQVFSGKTIMRWSLSADFEDVLESAPTNTDLAFIVRQMNSAILQEPCFRAITEIENLISDPVVVSVSGGVDSMVLLTLLAAKLPSISAVHIDYNNRSSKEAEFVRSWCAFLGIPLYIRSIKEIKREPCMEFGLRSTYETYTRNVRYATYKHVLEATCASAVVLGHNQDDCFENILTNLCHQEKLDNLVGMNRRSQIDGIAFLRPFLQLDKSAIYKAARYYRIPYLQDSTPAWSQRGRIRDNVRPVLEHWNPAMVGSLFTLSDTLGTLMELFNGQIQACVQKTQHIESVEDKSMRSLTLEDTLHTRTLLTYDGFWREYLKELTARVPSWRAISTAKDRIHKWYKAEKALALHLVFKKGVRVILVSHSQTIQICCMSCLIVPESS
jgi:tRNA(Ile)-lysidine synthetase-like protein